MAFLSQSMNTFGQSPILGQVDMVPTPDVVSAQILSTSSATSIQVGDPVKLVAGTSGAILVDKQTGPTDATVFGIIPYNERKNLYSPGDFIEVACGGTYVYLLSSGAIARGDTVSTTSSTTTADPTVATDTTSGHFITGTAVDVASGSGILIRVKIAPSTHA
jgi:hypothetical protein